jgi:hypothetical protein
MRLTSSQSLQSLGLCVRAKSLDNNFDTEYFLVAYITGTDQQFRQSP